MASYHVRIEATKEFKTWAEGFSGCDGNLSGTIWFCGIEYGGEKNQASFKFGDVASPAFFTAEDLPRRLRIQYDRKVAKFYAALMGESIGDYREFAIRKRLFDRESDVFKMNLYPIAFRNENERWQEWLFKKTGLPTKSMYRAWCQRYRFRKILGWIQESRARLVVATGTTYRDDFILAFSGPDELFRDVNETTVLDRKLSWKMINAGKTVLAITPFLGGRYGLNSDDLIQAFATEISGICTSQMGPDWRPGDSQSIE